MEIKQFDSKICKQIQLEMMELLKPLTEKYGLIVNPLSGSYTDISWKAKLEFNLDNPEKIQEDAKKTFEMYADIYGLLPSDYGKRIRLGGKFYTIAGIKTSAHKRSIVIMREDGKRFITTPQDVLCGLNRIKPISESFVLTGKDIGKLNLSDIDPKESY